MTRGGVASAKGLLTDPATGLPSFAYTSKVLQGAGTEEALWFSTSGIAVGAGVGLERGSAFPRTTETLFSARTAEFFFETLPGRASADPTNPADMRRFYEWSETLRDLDRDVAKDLAVRRDVYVEPVEALAKKYAVGADAPLEVVEQNARQANAERNAIMEETRLRLTDKGRSFSEAMKPEGKTYEQLLEKNLKGRDPSTVTEAELIEANKKIIASSGTSNADVTALARRAADLQRAQKVLVVAETGGKVLGVVGAAADGYSLGQAINRSVETGSADPALRESARIAGGWTGAWAGAKAGAAGGGAAGAWIGTAVLPGLGTATGAAVGATVGGVVGGVGGYIAGSNVATKVYDTAKSWVNTAKGWFK
jgi:hypothetical protein